MENNIENIPNLLLNEREIQQYFGSLEIRGKKTANSIISILGRRGVKLNDLRLSFEKIRFEDGLRIIGYPNENLQSIALFPEKITITPGSPLVLECHSTGFPFPKHQFLKDGHPIFEGNPLVIENAR